MTSPRVSICALYCCSRSFRSSSARREFLRESRVPSTSSAAADQDEASADQSLSQRHVARDPIVAATVGDSPAENRPVLPQEDRLGGGGTEIDAHAIIHAVAPARFCSIIWKYDSRRFLMLAAEKYRGFHQIALDEPSGPARAPFHLPENHELAGAEGIAALDGVDEQPVRVVVPDIAGEHLHPARQAEVRVAPHAVVRERLQRAGGIMSEAGVVNAADLRIAGGHDHRPLVGEHLPEFPEAGPVGRSLHHEAEPLLSHARRRA